MGEDLGVKTSSDEFRNRLYINLIMKIRMRVWQRFRGIIFSSLKQLIECMHISANITLFKENILTSYNYLRWIKRSNWFCLCRCKVDESPHKNKNWTLHITEYAHIWNIRLIAKRFVCTGKKILSNIHWAVIARSSFNIGGSEKKWMPSIIVLMFGWFAWFNWDWDNGWATHINIIDFLE